MSGGKAPCGATGWTAFDFSIHMVNDFLKYNIDLSLPFMIDTRNLTEILCAAIASENFRNRNGLINACIAGLILVLTFAFAVTSSMI